MNKNILITGGAGYIGSFVCRALKQAGYTPITFDNLSTGHKENVKWGPFVYGDLLDKKILAQTFLQYSPIAVMHFASSALVIESILNPGKYYENNVATTVNLLEAMQKHHISTIVFSSSCATYGNPVYIPINENHPQHPINPYGKSKMMIEMILEDYEKTYEIKSATLRYFNAAGADEKGEIGENHEVETHLIPLLIETAFEKRERFTVYGTDFPTEDKTAVRDYIHVEDLASAHLKALLYLLLNKKSLSVNLGTGQGISVKQMIDAVESYSGKKISVQYASRRTGEPAILVADAALAQKTLIWTPQYSDLNTIIRTAWNWHEKLLEKKGVKTGV